MGCDTVEKEIDGATFYVTPHKSRAGAKLAAKLMRIVAPMLANLKGQTITSIQKMDVGQLAPIFGSVISSLDDAQLDALIADVFARTSVNVEHDGVRKIYDLSKGVNIDDAFEGSLSLMFKGMWAAVEVNFGNFFGGSGQSVVVPVLEEMARPAP